jgi:hypothetical protein
MQTTTVAAPPVQLQGGAAQPTGPPAAQPIGPHTTGCATHLSRRAHPCHSQSPAPPSTCVPHIIQCTATTGAAPSCAHCSQLPPGDFRCLCPPQPWIPAGACAHCKNNFRQVHVHAASGLLRQVIVYTAIMDSCRCLCTLQPRGPVQVLMHTGSRNPRRCLCTLQQVFV